jgi:hypothetical protein
MFWKMHNNYLLFYSFSISIILTLPFNTASIAETVQVSPFKFVHSSHIAIYYTTITLILHTAITIAVQIFKVYLYFHIKDRTD